MGTNVEMSLQILNKVEKFRKYSQDLNIQRGLSSAKFSPDLIKGAAPAEPLRLHSWLQVVELGFCSTVLLRMSSLCSSDIGSLTSKCNTKCVCARSLYFPVCGIDGKSYFSPCHAGCQGAISKTVSDYFT